MSGGPHDFMSPDSRLQLDTLKIIKRFQAIFAFVMRFAGGGTKDTHHGGVLGIAVGAGDDFVFAQEAALIRCSVFWRGNAVFFEALTSNGSEPIGGPGWTEGGAHFVVFKTGFF